MICIIFLAIFPKTIGNQNDSFLWLPHPGGLVCGHQRRKLLLGLLHQAVPGRGERILSWGSPPYTPEENPPCDQAFF